MNDLLFNRQFCDDVIIGDKKQSIRRDTKIKVGEEFRLRAEDTLELLGFATCLDLLDFETDGISMKLNGHIVYAGSALRGEIDDRDNDFAEKDGFESFSAMCDFLREKYELPFKGKVIIWGELR